MIFKSNKQKQPGLKESNSDYDIIFISGKSAVL